MAERRIIHIDVNYFFTQVEVRDNLKLKERPVTVGSKASSRGAVSTTSYEARKCGVHPAVPISQAHKLYPNGYFVTNSFGVYRETPAQIMSIFRSYTDKVEPVSLDEAYLDITELVRPDLPTSKIAQYIRKDIPEQTYLAASAGVSYSKFLAKLASGMNKPDGTTVIDYQDVHGILMTLNIGDFSGVDETSKEVIHDDGIFNGRDLYEKTEFELIRLFGKRDQGLYNKARGIDHSEVKSSRVRRSVGTERTFAADMSGDGEILRKVWELSGKTAERLNELQKLAKTATVKIKTHQFETLSKQMSLRDSISSEEDIYNTTYLLYNDSKDPDVSIRLISVTVGNLE